MSKYLEIINKIVVGINEGYDTAKGDFIEILAEIEAGLKTILPNLSIDIHEINDSSDGTFYSVEVIPLPDDNVVGRARLGVYFISSQGYPITTGRMLANIKNFEASQAFLDRKELDNYFQDFLTDPGSKLVQTIAFAIRRRGDGDDVPF